MPWLGVKCSDAHPSQTACPSRSPLLESGERETLVPSPAHLPGAFQAGNTCSSARPCWSPVGAHWVDSSWEASGFPSLALSWMLAAVAPPVVLVMLGTSLTDVGAVFWWRIGSSSPGSASPVASTPTWPHHLCPSAPFGKRTTFLATIWHVLMAF